MPAPAAPAVLDEDVDLETTCALLGVSPDDVIAELQRRQAQKRQQALTRMALAAKAGGERRILRDRGEGGGEVDMMIDPVSFHYWGQRLGYECWDDPQFRREYKRDNPAARVRQRSDRLIVTVDGLRPAARPPAARIRGRRGRWAAT